MSPEGIAGEVMARAPGLRGYFTRTLMALCAQDTTVHRTPAAAAQGEAACLGIAAAELGGLLPVDALIEKRPIDPVIAGHADFTEPSGSCTLAEYIDDRYNVIAHVPGDAAAGIPMIYNAHIDTVAPFMAPRIDDGRVVGRGAVDDKGQAALLLAALKLLAQLDAAHRVRPKAPRVYQFVIEEETGGNGTLSALHDPALRGYAALVIEATDLAVHPANRGALWYQARLERTAPDVRMAELAADVVLALEDAGAALKAESAHPLFLPHHVQTCHGVLGPYGVHPSAVNAHVAYRVEGLSREALSEACACATAAYVARYGDKTAEADPETGGALVPRHLSVVRRPDGAFALDVFGKAGHMGAMHRCDCALIKGAYIVAEIVRRGGRVALAEGEPASVGDGVLLEGGQGFVPTHRMAEVAARLSAAAARGAAVHAQRRGLQGEARARLCAVDYRKLHNDAFAGDPSSRMMRALERTWALAGRRWEPPRGWEVSCDARIFHHFGHDVAVWGPGELRLAHSDQEALSIDAAMEALPLLALFMLSAGGAL